MICKGYAENNNKFLKSHDSYKPTSHIMYLDTDNLYGHSMMQLMPTEMLNWVNPKGFNLNKYSNGSTVGCFLEVDLYYPGELCDLNIGYVFLCINVCINYKS